MTVTRDGAVLRNWCGTMPVHRRLLDTREEYASTAAEIENFTFHQCRRGRSRLDQVVRIPVVAHVLWRDEAQNVGDEQIHSQLAVLNADFRRLNEDISAVPEVWRAVAADARVEFFLADTDPAGAPTSGITRTRTEVAAFSPEDDAVKAVATGGADPWPADRYLNMWVCQLAGGVLGYAQFPGGPATTDGVVLLHSALGTNGTAVAPFDGGRTCTHEVGHWLNLRHIWGDDGDGCGGDDFVADTPNQAGPNYGRPTFPTVSCDNGPDGDMFMNFMDYTDDDAMVMFTAGQAARMAATLAGPRAALAAGATLTR
ncbi:pregnancy-associated plasma protein-A [Micromonospora pisi]|uniref:Pregnancy-associated plasma protein-A n=1 Tax=Micromonospora pisi TaxID=589240 RepID=A0A495JST8_9ACTN|nr:zinc metalloprotease [Micromonospora pisi]RKR91432.1 pregnancy-associated plasma protein-A [Micromonospora pisi]